MLYTFSLPSVSHLQPVAYYLLDCAAPGSLLFFVSLFSDGLLIPVADGGSGAAGLAERELIWCARVFVVCHHDACRGARLLRRTL